MSTVDDCLFCKIVRKAIPADEILRDEDVVAFRDLNPQAPSHILLVPTVHAEDLSAYVAAGGATAARLLEAAAEHQKEWMDDTMQYIGERYALTPEQLSQVRALGDRFCQPVVKRANAAAPAETVTPETEAVEVGQE